VTVAEVDEYVNAFAQTAPARLVAAIQHITVHVARDRQDLAVLRAAVKEADQGPVAIPQDFRAVFIGVPLDPAAAGADDMAEVLDPISGVIILNAAKLVTPQDVIDTLMHEIGHALGFDEDEVAMLGLE